MTASNIFQIMNPIAMAGWLLLIAAPNWKHTKKITTIVISTFVFGGLYSFFIGSSFGHAEGGFDSLENVRKLFQNDYALLAGWVHYLAFDLFLGTWEIEDAKAHGISRWLVLPCQIMTFMYGPVGLLLYTILKIVLRKKVWE
ncbi:ABA4-like family protein [Leptospira idonii]|uniref:DUF4281 domain-containing protein n=1 Tax=Leptospira idonii TaxID=1193500 RepID=A0A4R9LWJ0_9LEPT|nr:ABA4-like family protein [Leptospira idonii]TGN17327.1 DUF4281 domain-containing protein [Leptospira idonii]